MTLLVKEYYFEFCRQNRFRYFWGYLLVYLFYFQQNTDSTPDSTVTASKVEEELYRRASVIEAQQVTEDIDEAVELEGRPHAHHFQRESSKKRKWRRTGMKALSQDFRDLL